MIPLFRPLCGKIASVCLLALFGVMGSGTVLAQTEADDLPDKCAYNKDVRTGTWSIYVQGGLSKAGGVWYQNIDAKKSYDLSPAVGGGVDYTIRPWVRVGAEYLYSRYRREQRMPSLTTTAMPVKAYGNYLMNYHNAKLGVGFNFMELWSGRKAQWLNIWVSTGVGYMMAKGNEYGIYFNTTITQDGVQKPANGDIHIDNNSNVSISGNVRTTNEHSSFNQWYLPAALHVEFDVTRRFTVGLKGEMDWILNGEDIAPSRLAFGLATLRYNFVGSKAIKQREHYDSRLAEMDNDVTNALRQAEAEKARADKAEAENQQLKQQNADLQRRLDECGDRVANQVVAKPSHTVFFAHNSSYFSKEQEVSLKDFALQYKGKKLSLLSEASSPGTKEYNLELSKKRLERVVEALKKLGFAGEDLQPRVAMGSERNINSPEARRVTVTVNEK